VEDEHANLRNEYANRQKFPFEMNPKAFSATLFEMNPTKTNPDFSDQNESSNPPTPATRQHKTKEMKKQKILEVS
jgi:hypothetical protein